MKTPSKAKVLKVDITLTVATFGLIILDSVSGIEDMIPNGGSWVLIVSVVFLNVARAIGLKDIILKLMGKKIGNKEEDKKVE